MWTYTLLLQILNMSLTATIVIILVLIARILLKKAPKIFSYVLWAVVLFRLICPVSFSSSLSLISIFHKPDVINGSMTYIPSDIVHTEYPKIDLPLTGINDIINDKLKRGEEQLVADPLEAPMAIATMIWLVGMAIMLSYSGASLFSLCRKLIGAVHFQNQVYLADHITTPFVLGVIRPKIYIPSTLKEQEQSYIILHEQSHIKRLDHVIKMLAYLVLSVHWFNPFVWVAFSCCVKDMEMSCDERVLRETGNGIKQAYATSLLSLATGRNTINGSPLAFGEGNPKSRIKNVLNFKKPVIGVMIGLVVLVSGLSVGLAMNGASKIALPKADAVVSIDLEHFVDYEFAGQITMVDRIVINDILYAMSDATKTPYGSVNDYPVADEYIVIRINLENEQRKLCLYKTGDYYLEEPYIAVYRAKNKVSDIYSVVNLYLHDEDGYKTGALLQDITIGTPMEAVHQKLGQPDGVLSGLRGDIYMPEDHIKIIIYYDHENLVEQIKTIADQPNPILEGNIITKEDLRSLAGKGSDLVFEDFKEYKGLNASSNFSKYVMVYAVEGGYRLIVNVGVEGGRPERAELQSIWGSSGIDIRTNDIDEFIQSHPSVPVDSQRLLTQADIEEGNGLENIFLEITKGDENIVPEVTLRVQDQQGNVIWKEGFSVSHAGWNSLFLYESDGKQYLLRYNPYMGQGYASYTYTLFTLQKDKEKVYLNNSIDFDIIGNAALDTKKLVTFANEINELLSKSLLLVSSESGEYTFGVSSAEKFYERYSWLDTYPKLYSIDDDLEARLKKYSDYVLSTRKMDRELTYQLTDGEVEKAKEAVINYYTNTVFKDRVVTLQQITDVAVYRSAVIPYKIRDRLIAFYAEMNDLAKRMIILTKEKDGEWQVINEGV